jgi:hypothetical protein
MYFPISKINTPNIARGKTKNQSFKDKGTILKKLPRGVYKRRNCNPIENKTA